MVSESDDDVSIGEVMERDREMILECDSEFVYESMVCDRRKEVENGDKEEEENGGENEVENGDEEKEEERDEVRDSREFDRDDDLNIAAHR